MLQAVAGGGAFGGPAGCHRVVRQACQLESVDARTLLKDAQTGDILTFRKTPECEAGIPFVAPRHPSVVSMRSLKRALVVCVHTS